MRKYWGLIVAKPGVVREGLQSVISAIPEVEALEPVADSHSVLEVLKSQPLDLIIFNSNLPEDNIQTTLGQIKERWPRVRCIVIVNSPQSVSSMETTGADAVLIEGFSVGHLSTTIRDQLSKIELGS